MTKTSPILFLALGILLLWAGVTGRLGAILAALFTPSKVQVSG